MTECDDGTMCENNSHCVPHPYKESKYVCDCASAHAGPAGSIVEGASDVRFAGVYCEHRATSYCRRGGGGGGGGGDDYANHAFCVNGGECRLMVGRNEEHAGCKCPPNYEGHYCQFVLGSRPSDWELTDAMNPALFSNGNYIGAYGGRDAGMSPGGIAGVTILVLLAIAVAGTWMFVDRDALGARASKLRGRFASRGGEGSDMSSASDAANNPTGMLSPQNAQFIGGKSVYNKRTTSGGFSSSSGPFVATTEALDADGGVLMAAMDDDQRLSMEEVDLNDDASVMVDKGKFA